jgi:GTP-binding protein Era
MLGQKLSIVSRTAQTTRERVLGIDTRGSAQLVFVDTPGLVEAGHLLHQSMRHSVALALPDADAIVLVVDATGSVPALSRDTREALHARGKDVVIALNKSDLATGDEMDQVAAWGREMVGAESIAVSARTGAGLNTLRAEIEVRVPRSPFLYPADEVATQSVRFFVAELIRESMLELYAREVPHSVAVKVDEFREASTPIYIRATIFVERASQKQIVIGTGGVAIKRLGARARHKVEALVGGPCYLDLWVKVLPKWRKDPELLRRMGYVTSPTVD